MDASRLLTDTITLQTPTGVDAGMTQTFGPQRKVKARVEHLIEQVPDAAGEVRVAKHQVTAASEMTLTDRIWLPGTDTSDPDEAERAISVGQASTPDGYTLYIARL